MNFQLTNNIGTLFELRPCSEFSEMKLSRCGATGWTTWSLVKSFCFCWFQVCLRFGFGQHFKRMMTFGFIYTCSEFVQQNRRIWDLDCLKKNINSFKLKSYSFSRLPCFAILPSKNPKTNVLSILCCFRCFIMIFRCFIMIFRRRIFFLNWNTI